MQSVSCGSSDDPRDESRSSHLPESTAIPRSELVEEVVDQFIHRLSVFLHSFDVNALVSSVGNLVPGANECIELLSLLVGLQDSWNSLVAGRTLRLTVGGDYLFGASQPELVPALGPCIQGELQSTSQSLFASAALGDTKKRISRTTRTCTFLGDSSLDQQLGAACRLQDRPRPQLVVRPTKGGRPTTAVACCWPAAT